LAAAARDPKQKRLAAVWDLYEGLLRQANALDFDDLLLETVRLLTATTNCAPLTTSASITC
jgi:DNA helicase-2/ATP-dependent DNA helicase PcrA